MRFLGVGVWLVVFVVGGIGVAPVVATAAEPQAAAPVAAAEKVKPQNEKSVAEPIPWPEKYDPRTLKPIRLFMTREEVRELWGQPERYLYGDRDFGSKRGTRDYFLPEEYDEGMKRYGSLMDAYFRKTATNRYQIRIGFKLDQSGNSNQPEMRVN